MKPTAIIGESYPVGMGVEVDASEVWVAYFNLTSISATAAAVGYTVPFINKYPSYIIAKQINMCTF